MIKVEIELKDLNELDGFANFLSQVMQYRAANSSPAAAPVQPTAASPAAATTPPEVVGHIAPKAPKESELTEATQAYLKANGIEKTMAVVRKYGVQKVTELKDPVKAAELLAELKAGVE